MKRERNDHMDRANEKRKTPRIDENLPIKIVESDSGMVVETKNISASGAYFTTDKAMPLMSKVMITMLMPESEGKNSRIKCGGTVVRMVPVVSQDGTTRYETAVFFDDITEKAKNIIIRHVNKIMEQS